MPVGENRTVKLEAIPDKPTDGVVVIVLKRGKPLARRDLILPNQLPKSVREVLDRAEQIELLSLNPARDRKPAKQADFHGYEVIGKTVLEDKKACRQLLRAFSEGVDDSTGAVAGCFNPRHGIRDRHDGKTTELVICYECLSLQIYGPDRYKGSVLTTQGPSALFNKVLRKAGVPLPKK